MLLVAGSCGQLLDGRLAAGVPGEADNQPHLLFHYETDRSYRKTKGNTQYKLSGGILGNSETKKS